MPTLDPTLVTSLVDITKSVMGLATNYPINLYIAASFAFIAIGLFGSFKSSAR